jgi:hypothetical protein
LAYWFTGWRLVVWFLLAFVVIVTVISETLQPA